MRKPRILNVRSTWVVTSLLLCLSVLGFSSSALAQATPVAPGNLQATFQRTGNATQLTWSARGQYTTSADLRVLGSYNFTPTDALSSWDRIGGLWSVNGNVLRQGSGILTTTSIVYPGGDNLTDYTLNLRVRATGGLITLGALQAGVLFRIRGGNNFYALVIDSNEVVLLRRQNGTDTALGRFAMNRVTGQWYAVKIELRGSSIRISIDGTQRFNVTDSAHAMGSFGMFTIGQRAEFAGPTNSGFELRDALGFQAFTPATIRGQWNSFGPGNWTNTTYELRQSVNTPTQTGYTHDKHGDRQDYTYVQQMRISPANDDDVMGVIVRYTQNQANPHRFTGYVFEWSGGGSGGAPFRRLVRVVNGGYGNHTGTNAWQRINHTILHSDNTSWSSNTWYLIKIQVSGNVIRVWINGTLWTTYTDNSRAQITKGSFGLLNYSNPNFNVRHVTVRYADNEFTKVAGVDRTAAIGTAWTQLSTTTVGTTMATPINTWASGLSIPRAHVDIVRYNIDMADPSTFEGKLATSASGAAANTDPNAFPFGQQKSGTIRYHVYRNNVRITSAPITAASYKDQYGACTPPPGTKYDYQVTMLNPANTESGRSNTASITTANDAPTISGVPDQTATHGQSLTLNVASYINDINVPNNTLTISENSQYATVSGQVITFLYPAGNPITSEQVTITVTDCHGAKASQTITVTLNNRPPVITSTPSTSATQGQAYSYTATATDPDAGDTLTYKMNKMPAAATFNATTRTITWTPTNADVGKSFDFELEVCDQKGACVKQTWSVTVINVNDPPTITSTPPTTGTEDQAYSYKPTATDPDAGDTLTWKINNPPAGATIDATTGEVKWTPGDAHGGKDVDFEIQVCDQNGACATQTWKVKVTNVNDPPTITSTPPTTGTEDQPYSYKPTVSDPDPNETLTYKLKNPPAGATIDPTTGEIKWTPGDEHGGRDVDFELEVCDKSGTCVTQKWKVKVTNVNDPPSFTGTPPTTAQEGQKYEYEPKATDPDPGDNAGLKYSLKNAPQGATIDPTTGKISWTPNADDVKAGTRDFEVEVCDANGACATQKWTVTVNNVNDPPVISGTPPTTAEVGQQLTYGPTVTDPDPSDTHTWKLTKGPPGATVDPATGELKWTPAAADAGKEIEFEIEVCDNGTPPSCTRQSFKVKVNNPCSFDADCPSGQICVTGTCVPGGCDAKNPKCPSGQICQNGQCVTDPCGNVTCQSGETCRPSDGKCIKTCSGVTCQQNELCVDGQCVANPCTPPCAADEYCQTTGSMPTCVKNPCTPTSCRYGRLCKEGQCVPDPCENLTCPTGQRCLAGQCVDPQACNLDIDCPGDEVCINQKCTPAGCYKGTNCQGNQQCLKATCTNDPCQGNACNSGEYCRVTDGACAKPCDGVTCSANQKCEDGTCTTDPCAGITCKAGEYCLAGACKRDLCNASNVCKHGRVCDQSQCQDDPCKDVKCPGNQQVCVKGQCVASGCQFDKDCNGDDICVNRKCVAATCPKTPCANGERCQDGKCLKDPCDGVTCQADEVCKSAPGSNTGLCVGSCAGVFCAKGTTCVDGQCVADPCGNVSCNAGEVCQNGVCVKDQCAQGACKDGRLCRADKCIDDPCRGVNCPSGQQCQPQSTTNGDGQCVGDKPCEYDSDCVADGVCVDKKCAAPGCYREACPAGKLCLKGQCVDDPCANKQCNANEVCRPADGTCVPTCPTCASGERCNNGTCEKDPCDGVTCNADERCDNGTCVKDPCADPNAMLCKYQRACGNKTCSDDSCTGVTCADGTCRNGTCTRPPGNTEGVTEGVTDGGEATPDATTDNGGTDNGGTDGTPGEATNTDNGGTDAINQDGTGNDNAGSDNPLFIGGGCGCNTTPHAPLGGFLLILALCFAFRRQRTS